MNLEKIIAEAFAEDIPHEDITTKTLGVSEYLGQAKLLAKEDLVLSGSSVFEMCLKYVSPSAELKWYFQDGDIALLNHTICVVRGNLVEILRAERVALNFLGHLSGVATLTRCFVKEIQNTRCKILHTRKTTPLLRDLEIKAVKDGGGHAHRRDLSSAILIKENHIAVAGSIKKAIEQAKTLQDFKIEVETRSLEDVKLAVSEQVDRIMFDNFSDEMLVAATKLVPATIETEASGNMSLERIKSVANTGVDYISIGRITHSAPTADLSLLFDWKKP